MLLAFVGFEIGLSMSGNQVLAILFFLIVMAVLFYFLLQKGKKGTEMEAATEAAVNYWKRTYGEELSRDGSLKLKTCFKDGVFYGFRLRRLTGPKSGQFACIVVEKNPSGFNVAKDSDQPTPEELADPFKLLDGFLFRTPVPISGETLTKNLANQFPYRNPQISVNVGQEKKEDEFKKMGGG